VCSGQNSLGKGGLNAKAGFCYPYNNRYISFLPSDDTEIFISRNVKAKRREFIECDIRKSPFSKPCVMDTDSVNKRILEAYYRNGYCTKCKAQMPTEVLHGKISQRSIKFCFNCGAKINGFLWTLIEEGIIKEK
jgi:hypothetical protein